MKETGYVGVDVSAKTLAVVVERDDVRGAVLEFSNDPDGHRKLISLITKRGRHARVVLGRPRATTASTWPSLCTGPNESR